MLKLKRKPFNPMSNQEKFKCTEQMRMIRSNILLSKGKEPSVFMVSSPNVIKKKAIITSKLALAFAEQGKRVLVVDADFTSPELDLLFQAKNKTGLANILENDGEGLTEIQESGVLGVDLLTAGRTLWNVAASLTNEKLGLLFSNWKRKYDIVLVDSPPLLERAEAQLIGDVCNGIILVVKQYGTRKEELLETKKYLDRLDHKLAGVIYQER